MTGRELRRRRRREASGWVAVGMLLQWGLVFGLMAWRYDCPLAGWLVVGCRSAVSRTLTLLASLGAFGAAGALYGWLAWSEAERVLRGRP